GDRLEGQRRETDASLSKLKSFLAAFPFKEYDPQLHQIATTADASVNALASKRHQVTAQELTVLQGAGYYTETIAHMIDVIKQMMVLSPNGRVSNAIAAYVGLIEAKERMGLERATGSGGFAAQKFAPALYQRFIALIAEQAVFLNHFQTFATPAQTAFLRETVSGQTVEEVKRMEALAVGSLEAGNTGGVEAPGGSTP
ncbi:MAG: methyl-accepting chemotaxis protein, partial [Rhodospirillaceae bacterium]